jgi:hypothetical protein
MRFLPDFLSQCEAITSAQLVQGLADIIGMVEDLKMDIPKVSLLG